jgi:hypothetical protein
MIKYLIEWGKKFGFRELFKKPFQVIFAPFIVRFKKQRFFILNKIQYPLFYHSYNFTWTKERAVEIPIAIDFIKESKGRILEVGNVLSHYFKPTWDIVDKYEKGKGVLNKDIETFNPKKKYDLIVAISTFEHIGFDSELNPEDSPRKIAAAFKNLKTNCLNKGGKILITTPLGYNPAMDKIAFTNSLDFTKTSFIQKIKKDEWVQMPSIEAKKVCYGKPFPFGNGIFIGEYIKK